MSRPRRCTTATARRLVAVTVVVCTVLFLRLGAHLEPNAPHPVPPAPSDSTAAPTNTTGLRSAAPLRCQAVPGTKPVPSFTASGPADALVAGEEVLVVVGIPSVDLPHGAERRDLQRASWMTYPRVWRNEREHGAVTPNSMVVRFVLGRHPANNYTLTQALAREQTRHQDVVAFDLNEGRPVTSKRPGSAGHWGLETEVGMSRKAFAWYCWCAATYRRARFVMKADDDFFLRVPRFLSDLAHVPPTRTYWGPVMLWGARKGDASSQFPFVGGMAIAMSRDLVEWIGASERAAVNQGPFHGDRAQYKATNHDHEDVMVGRMFYDARLNITVIRDCRFHDVHAGARQRPITPRGSIGVHHLLPHEYAALMTRFPAAVVVGDDDGGVAAALRAPPTRHFAWGTRMYTVC